MRFREFWVPESSMNYPINFFVAWKNLSELFVWQIAVSVNL
jgi:hypothetical protein